MKYKLLRKIRKRFEWYKNKKGDWYLIDNITKETFFIDESYAKRRWSKYDEAKNIVEPDCGWEEFKFRSFKTTLLRPFYSRPMDIIMFRGLRASIRNKNRKKMKR